MNRFSGKSSLRNKDEGIPPSGPSRQAALDAYLETRYGTKGTKKKKRTKPQKSQSSSVRIVDSDITGFAPTTDTFEVTVADPDAPAVVDAKELRKARQKKKSAKRGQWTTIETDIDDDRFKQEAMSGSCLHYDSMDLERDETEGVKQIPVQHQFLDDLIETPDLSPPRRGADKLRGQSIDVDLSPPRRTSQRREQEDVSARQRHTDDVDLSPPRRSTREGNGDLSPPRRTSKEIDGDLSPPRRPSDGIKAEDMSFPRKQARARRTSASGSVRRSLTEGLPSGMITAEKIKEELRRKRQQDKERLAEMEDYATGKGAQTVYRNKEGRRVTLEELQKEEAQDKKKIKWEKVEWDGGMAQQQEAKRRRSELDRERAKPFARAREDEDLDAMYRARRRWGDPMGHLDKKAKIQRGHADPPPVIDDTNRHWFEKSGFVIPQDIPEHSWIRRGVAVLSNRFNIRPGRHWDGVDRSNGFEREYAKYINECAAKDREAAAWCMEDM